MRQMHLRAPAVMMMLPLVALCCCARADGQVLDQVPDDALAVLKIQKLNDVSKKFARVFKDLGLDQLEGGLTDPLGTVLDQLNIAKGVDRNGDLALVFLDADKMGGPKEKNGAAAPAGADHPAAVAGGAGGPADKTLDALLLLVPISDYKAFLGNFENVKDEGGTVAQVKAANFDRPLYVANWAKYAAVSISNGPLAKKPTGLKLEGLPAKEAESKDAILYANMKLLRPRLQMAAKLLRQQVQNAKEGNDGPGPAAPDRRRRGRVPLSPMTPLAKPAAKAAALQYLVALDRFAGDARAVVLGMSLSEAGVSTSSVMEFEPGSYLGKLAGRMKNTDAPLLAGLPQRQYFAFGGAKLDPDLARQLIGDVLDPLQKDMAAAAGGVQGKIINISFDLMKQFLGSAESMSFGYAAPAGEGQAGQSLVQQVFVARGDAKAMYDAEKSAMTDLSRLAADGAGGAKPLVQFKLKPAAATVEGVPVDRFTLNVNLDTNTPEGANAKQMISIIGGRDGLTGAMAAIDNKTFVLVQGGTDDLVKSAVAAAKKQNDALVKAEDVQSVAGQLPRNRVAEYYINLGAITKATVKLAREQGLGIKFKLPPDLPPIGVTVSSEGAAVRIDSFVPFPLIRGMTAAGYQAYMESVGGNGDGGGL